MLILMCAFIVHVLFFFFFFDCQVDFDVDNVQHREFVDFYGVVGLGHSSVSLNSDGRLPVSLCFSAATPFLL